MKSDLEFKEIVTAQLESGERRMDDLTADVAKVKEQLAENTEVTARVERNTKELLHVFESWKGAMRAFEMIGKLAKPLSYILSVGAAIAAIWAALKTGHPR